IPYFSDTASARLPPRDASQTNSGLLLELRPMNQKSRWRKSDGEPCFLRRASRSEIPPNFCKFGSQILVRLTAVAVGPRLGGNNLREVSMKNMRKITRRDAINYSCMTVAGLSLVGLKPTKLVAQGQPQAQEPWPDTLVERPLRNIAPLPLTPDGSPPEHSPNEAAPLSEPT